MAQLKSVTVGLERTTKVAESDSYFGQRQIALLFRLIRGSVSLVGEHEEVQMCHKLIETRHARQVALAEKPVAIATLDGVSVFRRHYNALNLADALEQHQKTLQLYS